MKRICCLLGLVVLLTGCSAENRDLKDAMEFREMLLSSRSFAFQADVTADYGDSLNQFSMDCRADEQGTLHFEILKPESIAGIKGRISQEGGNILFEDQALYFPLLTDDLLTPASAPWIFLKALRSGYIRAVCREEACLHVTLDDSYAEDALQVDVWIEDQMPVHADILHAGKRILTLSLKNTVFS